MASLVGVPVGVQRDLFNDITDKLVEYRDVTRNFWRVGRGVGLTYDRRKRVTLAIVQPVGNKRALKLPLQCVRLYTEQDR